MMPHTFGDGAEGLHGRRRHTGGCAELTVQLLATPRQPFILT